jgi:subtilase family serine protease
MDPTNAVPETNEGNNQSTTTTIVVPKGPDLTIDLTGSDATAVGLGEVKYKVQIKNIGDRATSASPTLVATFPSAVHYLRVENSQFGGCNYGNGTIHCGVGNSLAAGATESAQFVAKVDQNVAQNTHISFTATADPTNAIQEFVENNNNASFTTTLIEIADLFVTGVTHVKFQCDKNGDFVPETTYHTITANVRNTGHTSAGATKVMMEIVGGFNSEAIDCGTHKQMVSCNGCSGAIASICTSTSAGATCDINPLAPNGTQQLLITVEDDEDVSAGAYTAKFIVDSGNSILESNENNNQTNHTVD